MSEEPCEVCNGLGYRSLDGRKIDPAANVYGLTRKAHWTGEVTWEGDCCYCGGTGVTRTEVEKLENPWKASLFAKLCSIFKWR